MVIRRWSFVVCPALVAVVALSGCVSGDKSPLGVTADSVQVAPGVVVADSTVVHLLSDSGERSAGTYRFQVRSGALTVQAGDVLVGAEQDGFLRRVTAVAWSGDTLTLSTTPAALSDAVISGAFEVATGVAPGGGATTQRAAGVQLGPTNAAALLSGVALSTGGLALNNTVLHDGQLCSGSACATVRIVVDSGFIAFNPGISIGGTISDSKLTEFHALTTGTTGLKAAVSVDVGGSLDAGIDTTLAVFTKWFATAVGSIPVVGVAQLAFVAQVDLHAEAAVGVTTGFYAVDSVSAGARYGNGGWSAVLAGRHSYAHTTPSFYGPAAGDVRVTVRPKLTVLFYQVEGSFIDAGSYVRFVKTLDGATTHAELAAASVANLGMRLEVLGHSAAAWAYQAATAESVLFDTTMVKPVVTAVSPVNGPVSGGTHVTLTGMNFVDVSSVTIGGNALTNVEVVSSTQITGATPASATFGAKDVVVVTSAGSSGQCTKCYAYRPSTLVWQSDFESDPVGSWPATWIKDANANDGSTNFVDATVSYAGEKSLREFGLLGGCWASIAYRSLTVTPPFYVEAVVRNGDETLYGCHPYRADVTLRECCTWTNPARALVTFRGDAIESSAEDTLARYQPLVWYKVGVLYERPSPSEVRITYWINDQYEGVEVLAASAAEDLLQHLQLEVGEGAAWFDNVSVYH
jgi:hypothetical protein